MTEKLFRFTAIAEACSWVGLLIGMFFKYALVHNEAGVKIFGPVHGGLFVLYSLSVLLAARAYRWDPRITLYGLLAGILPLTTLWFERRAPRRLATA
jgi:integral membrane protein